MNVVELFSGIGAQAKALERANIDHNILATCDWDVNAIIAYDIIHYGPQNNNLYLNMDSNELTQRILNLNISSNGKKPMSDSAKVRMPRTVKASLLYAIERTNNLIDITNINGIDLPPNIDLMTYSFPCQDLSLAGNWHNNQGGIERNSGSRSSLLWEVERLLQERNNNNFQMPRFLLMENVTAIESTRHIRNFEEWQRTLQRLGYVNCIYTLDARDFGVPQMRCRTYMLSTYINDIQDGNTRNEFCNYFSNQTSENLINMFRRNQLNLHDLLRTNYQEEQYLREAEESCPNRTVSRIDIGNNNLYITEDVEFIPTITTKQDRHPNSGLIRYHSIQNNKMNFRYLTPRECFLFMGFDEDDFQALVDNNFYSRRNTLFFSRDKLNKMAGNSICVNVLESIFEYIDMLNEMFF